MDDAKAIGARIRQARIKSGLTQVDLAAAIGVSRAHLTNVEGGNGGLALEKLSALAAETGTTVAWLIGENGAGDPQEAALIAAYRRLDPAKREIVLAVALGFAPSDQTVDPTPVSATKRRAAGCIVAMPRPRSGV